VVIDAGATGPWLRDVRHRRDTFVLTCPEWVTPPGLTAVLGLNGAGKSTLLDLLSGRQRPTEGAIGGIGDFVLLPQSASLRVRQRVEDVYLYLAALRGIPRRTRATDVARVIDACGLREQAQVPARHLSGGWHQRVLIGQCLFGDPAGLLLDEPTSALDVAAARACWQLLTRLARQRPVVVATHEASAALEFADQLVLIHAGAVSRPRSGLELRALRDAYDGSAEGFLLSLIAESPRDAA
jgi:ABC-2 type transport system ATP-binding protein